MMSNLIKPGFLKEGLSDKLLISAGLIGFFATSASPVALDGLILKEDGFYLLCENGDYLALEQ